LFGFKKNRVIFNEQGAEAPWSWDSLGRAILVLQQIKTPTFTSSAIQSCRSISPFLI